MDNTETAKPIDPASVTETGDVVVTQDEPFERSGRDTMTMPDGTPIGVVLARAHMMFQNYHGNDLAMQNVEDPFAHKAE